MPSELDLDQLVIRSGEAALVPEDGVWVEEETGRR